MMKEPLKIPADALIRARLKLDEAAAIMEPFVTGLSVPRRRRLRSIWKNSIDFVKISHELASQYPSLFPRFINKSLFGNAYTNARNLRVLTAKLEKLKNLLTDTELLAGNTALELALEYYDTIKIAARRHYPGAGLIYDELKQSFPFRKRRASRRPGKTVPVQGPGQRLLTGQFPHSGLRA